ncbi:MAG: ABC transporter permease [Candidatus Binatia bacterium]|nr:ABC transporter permease [Candidatus Binatia bacterium]
MNSTGVPRWMRAAAPAGAAVALALVLTGLMAAVVGASPLQAIGALISGSVGSGGSLAATLLGTSPLLLTGLAVMLAFRSGVFNIGAEGQLLVGALVATAVATRTGSWTGQAVLVLVSGAVAGALWAAMAAFLRERRGVSEVITTILLNFVALYLVSYAVNGPLKEQSGAYPQSDPFPVTAELWRLVPGSRLHVGLLIGLVAVVVVGALLSRTSLGLRLRSSGLNPSAARVAGFPVGRDLFLAFAASGALAGLAGAIEVAGVTGRLYERMSPGYGYTAIAIALLGGLRSGGVLLAALFFAALGTGASAMERSAGISAVLAVAIQGATLLAVAVISRTSWTGLASAPPLADSESRDAA